MAAYVTPLVVSMPVRASKAGYGSGSTDPGRKHSDGGGKDKQAVKYAPKGCPDPMDMNENESGDSFRKYSRSPYAPGKQLSQGPESYQFQGNFKSHSKQ